MLGVPIWRYVLTWKMVQQDGIWSFGFPLTQAQTGQPLLLPWEESTNSCERGS